MSFPRLALVAVAAALLVTAPARADDTSPRYERKAATEEYVAPLSQTTQPSYVPQSVALSGPREIRNYEEGDPIPPGYRPVQRTRRGLIVGGAVTFGVLYFFSALAASMAADASGDRPNPAVALWVPGVGPFIQMLKTDSATANVFLAIDGIGQTAGLAMLVIGLTSPKTVLVRNDLADAKKPKLELKPLVGAHMSGLGLSGTF